jgi:hypothetical protein
MSVTLDCYLRFAIEHLMVPSRVEQWNIIIDLNGVGWTELYVKFLGKLIKNSQNRYRGRS